MDFGHNGTSYTTLCGRLLGYSKEHEPIVQFAPDLNLITFLLAQKNFLMSPNDDPNVRIRKDFSLFSNYGFTFRPILSARHWLVVILAPLVLVS